MKKIIVTILLVLCAHSATASTVTSYVVEKAGSGDKVLVSDGSSEYMIQHDYNCSSYDFSQGLIFYINSLYSPSYGDTIIITGYSKKTCEVTDSKLVRIKQYYVDDVFDSEDKIIVTAQNGTKYLVEYGLGCGLSMWRYEGKTVDIDIGGSFLDGIGDTMYLMNSDRDCRIWDAEELGNNTSGVGLNYPLTNTQTYVAPTTINTPQSCIKDHGARSVLSGNECTCEDNYMFDQSKQCMPAGDVCLKEYGKGGIPSTVNACACANGFHINGRSCVEDPKPIKNIPYNVKKWSDDNYVTNTPCSQNISFTEDELKICEEYSASLYRYKYDWKAVYPNPVPVPTQVTLVQKTVTPTNDPLPVKKETGEIQKTNQWKPTLALKNFSTQQKDIESVDFKSILQVSATMYSCPSIECSIIRYYAEGSELSVSGIYKDENWYRVEGTKDAGGSGTKVTGWIQKILFKQNEALVSVPELDSSSTTMEATPTIQKVAAPQVPAIPENKPEINLWGRIKQWLHFW